MTVPATPRLAATLLLMREPPLEVLMLRRSGTGSFASALVFPGGVLAAEDRAPDWSSLTVDGDGLDADERAFRIAALRETFEEAGLLPLVDDDGRDLAWGGCAARTDFAGAVRASGGRLPLDRLVPFAHWITPATAPKRYDTRFYLMLAPPGQEAACDGAETIAFEWRRPGDTAEHAPDLPFPTRLNLARLGESATAAAALAAARARPPFTVLPQVEQRADGVFVVIPREAGYAVSEERRPGGRLG